MSTYKEALEKIMAKCAQSRTYTRRNQEIHEIAMYALGLTASQRHARHVAIMDRIGDASPKGLFIKREEKRAEKIADRNANNLGETQ